jgi:hypothetical protein
LQSPLSKKIGILDGDSGYIEAKKLSEAIAEANKKLRNKLHEIANSLSLQIGRDPVSVSYSGLAEAIRDLKLDEAKKKDFEEELDWRFSHKIPPGYMDASNPAGGAGDLLIWRTLLEEGKTQQKDLIFVTGEEKSDWWLRNHGAFQPRLELIEEYRAFTGGYTIHLMPLSRLLSLLKVESATLAAVRNAETANTVAAAISSAQTDLGHYLFRVEVSPEQAKQLAATRGALLQEATLAAEEIQNWTAGMGWLPQDQQPVAVIRLRERLRNLWAQIHWLDQQLTLTPPPPDDRSNGT